ncbi:MAG: DUF3515 family protein [Nocardioides alkalitolerans]
MPSSPRRTPRAAAGLALALVGATVGLTACGADPVRVEGAPALADLPDADRAACEAVLDALPDEVDGQEVRAIEQDGLAARAWGEPAVVVVCGVAMPDSFTEISDCEEVGGVGWYAEPATYRDQTTDAVLTTIGQVPVVELRIPAERRPPVEEMVDVAPAVLAGTETVSPCV